MWNIPAHKNCKNCGDCCGVIPAAANEIKHIQEYLDKHPMIREIAQRQSHSIKCPFRDETNRKCLIYPVRPIVCRLMGVCSGMSCTYGNSNNIDGTALIKGDSMADVIILNSMDWRKED